MDNPAVSEPAVPERLSGQQVSIGTETKTDSTAPSPVSESVAIATQVSSKNNEGWRRVVRNFSPSCESLDVAFRHHPVAAMALISVYRVRNDNGHRNRRSHLLHHPMGCSLAVLAEHHLLRPEHAIVPARSRSVSPPLHHMA